MNHGRRKDIRKAAGMVAEALALLADAKELVEQSKDAEQEYLDNMPQNWQDGEKGQTAEAAINNLEEAFSALEEFENAGVEDLLSDAAE